MGHKTLKELESRVEQIMAEYTVEQLLKGDTQAMHRDALAQAQRELIDWKETDYQNRAEYLAEQADIYGLELNIVESLADLLGDTELFDGLLVALEDAEGTF